MSNGLWITIIALIGIGVVYLFQKTGSGSKQSQKETVRRLNRRNPVGAVDAASREKEIDVLHPEQPNIGPGLTIGYMGDHKDRKLIQGWRECATHVWGTGRGKTTSQVITHSYEAPGPFIMTGNKPDGVWEVIAARRDRGRIWICDAQNILDDHPWPLMTINLFSSIRDTLTADEVSEIFQVSTSQGSNAKRDPQFDSQGRDLLSACFLAAMEAKLPPSKVLSWITSSKLIEPEGILQSAGHYGRASLLEGISKQPDDTRGSVFATAQRMASPLGHDSLLKWATPTEGVTSFSPDKFVESEDTLILLAQETGGSGSAFISTVIHSIFASAMRKARSRGGRLEVPLVADLDEVGNVVKLPQLPEWFSFFGSMGIVVSAYFQTRGQGINMLSQTGWDTLWSASAVRVYGGGSDDDKFLDTLRKLSGTYEHLQRTNSSSRGQRSTSTSYQQRDILPVDRLAGLDRWHAWVRTNLGGSTIVRTVPWFKNDDLEPWITEGLEEVR